MQMQDCPKFKRSSAPTCPLDDDWKLRSHLDSDRACYYFTEYAKSAFRPLLRRVLAGELYEGIGEQHPRIIDAHALIKRRLLSSSKKNSRLAVEEI